MKTVTVPKGIWSASPTPFTDKMELDIPSVERLVEHHLRLGVKGLFLAGTCGEGPYMRNEDIARLVKETKRAAAGRLMLSVQVTDNSAVRILDNVKRVADAGADIAVIAPPNFRINNTPENLKQMYVDAVGKSELPVGVYDRGTNGPVVVPEEVLSEIYLEENVVLVKDSSADPKHRELALEARKKRPELVLFNGDEFDCITYLKAGYDGLLLGGGSFNGYMAGLIREKIEKGDNRGAEEINSTMIDIMYCAFGGRDASCWLSGQKRLMVELGVFTTWKSYYNFPLTKECEGDIINLVKEHKDLLFPR